MTSKIKVTVLVGGAILIGYLLGNMNGKTSGYQAHAEHQKRKSMSELKAELKEKEQRQILTLLEESAEIKRVDEGGLFRTKYIHYLYGKVANNAAVATVKNVRLQLEFFSKTEAKINSNELILYEFIQPNQIHSFKQKINWPNDAEKFRLTILGAEVN